jgi:hypothetical protein
MFILLDTYQHSLKLTTQGSHFKIQSKETHGHCLVWNTTLLAFASFGASPPFYLFVGEFAGRPQLELAIDAINTLNPLAKKNL